MNRLLSGDILEEKIFKKKTDKKYATMVVPNTTLMITIFMTSVENTIFN